VAGVAGAGRARVGPAFPLIFGGNSPVARPFPNRSRIRRVASRWGC
jgi:hypothetical protein